MEQLLDQKQQPGGVAFGVVENAVLARRLLGRARDPAASTVRRQPCGGDDRPSSPKRSRNPPGGKDSRAPTVLMPSLNSVSRNLGSIFKRLSGKLLAACRSSAASRKIVIPCFGFGDRISAEAGEADDQIGVEIPALNDLA